MQAIIQLLLQPSSFAGYALLAQAIPQIVMAPASVTAWATLFAALAAILKSETPR